MPTKVLIVGSAGQLGVELVHEFESRGYAVTGVDRAEVDITDQAAAERCIAGLDPALVINAAAYNAVDVAE